MHAEELPTFFIPGVEPEKAEETFAALAELGHCGVPGPEQRVYSISYMHDGMEWTATVGKQLSGVEPLRRRVRGEMREQMRYRSDSATVLAIFPGHPFTVFHDNNRSAWNQPFYAGNPHVVRLFRHQAG